MYGIALYCNETCGGGMVRWWCGICGIVIPLQVIQLCSTLDCGNMYGIALYCNNTCGGGVVGCGGGVVWDLWDSNTTPGYTTLLSALPWIVAIIMG